MSSSTNLDTLRFVAQQINLYGGLFVFITGIFGELLNIIVFTSLKTFRQTACSFYLVTASTANIGVLIVILLRIIYDGFNFGLSYTPLLCKFRYFLAQYGGLVSLTSMCLAAIDQFISMTRYKRWNNLWLAHRLIAFACVLWFINDLFSFIYYDSNLNMCILTNSIYAKYYTYFQSLILLSILPLGILLTFSVLSFFKIRTIASRQINIVRLSRDRQLTAMTLYHVLFTVILNLPFVIFFVYMLSIHDKYSIDIVKSQFIYSITVLLYYISYSCSFYIYCCVSKRFRKQVTYVLIDIHLNRWRRRVNNLNNNTVIPYPLNIENEHGRIIPVLPNDIALY